MTGYCGAMSRENVEVVRQVVELNRFPWWGQPATPPTQSGELDERVLALCHENVEYTSITAELEPQTYRGHDGLRRYASDMGEAWEEWRNEAEEIFELAPDTVLATIHSRVVGKSSGATVEARLAAVFVLADGKVLRGHIYPSRAEALEAAGLAE